MTAGDVSTSSAASVPSTVMASFGERWSGSDWDDLDPLSSSASQHASVYDFYARETELLDETRLELWLEELVHPDIEYVMPVRSTRLLRDGNEFAGRMTHLEESHASFVTRVARGASGVAWAEDPPSRARRHVSSLRTYEHPDVEDKLWARMNVLLTRSRHDDPYYQLLSYERFDRLVRDDGILRLHQRVILADQSCLGLVNLAILL